MLNLFLGLFFGILLATFSSSIFYRLPRNISLYGFLDTNLKPFCSKCNHPLKFYEYYSVLSWIFCRGKCNYCKQPISKEFIILESAIIMVSIIAAFVFGMSEQYLISCFMGVLLISCAIIYNSKSKIPNSIFISMLYIAIFNHAYFIADFSSSMRYTAITAIILMALLKFLTRARIIVNELLILSIMHIFTANTPVISTLLLISFMKKRAFNIITAFCMLSIFL